MQDHLPPIYKYRTINAFTEAIFTRRELYFAPPSTFNDPFDCGFHILCGGSHNQQIFTSGAFQTIRQRHPDWPLEDVFDAAEQVGSAIAKDHLDKANAIFQEKLSNDTDQRVGILALSETHDDILMWSHYAECHKGICIGFSTQHDGEFFSRAQRVIYGDEYPHLDLREVVVNEQLRATAPWMLKKSSNWAYEREWRVLDFDAEPGVRQFPAACLTKVILGCRMVDEDKSSVLKWIEQFPNKIEVFQARVSPTHFRLEIEAIA
jgi:hypothetical protein